MRWKATRRERPGRLAVERGPLRRVWSLRSPIELELAASIGSPIESPAFVIKHWGGSDASLSIDGREIERGASFRCGHRTTLEGTDLIVWVELDSTAPVRLKWQPR